MRAVSLGRLLLAGSLLLSLPVPAAGDVERARTLLAEGDHARAVIELEKAHAATRDPRLLHSIGQCYQMLGDFPRAVGAYTRYLSEAPNAVDAAEVGRLIDELTPLTFADAP